MTFQAYVSNDFSQCELNGFDGRTIERFVKICLHRHTDAVQRKICLTLSPTLIDHTTSMTHGTVVDPSFLSKFKNKPFRILKVNENNEEIASCFFLYSLLVAIRTSINNHTQAI
jgi:hypothetical protein